MSWCVGSKGASCTRFIVVPNNSCYDYAMNRSATFCAADAHAVLGEEGPAGTATADADGTPTAATVPTVNAMPTAR